MIRFLRAAFAALVCISSTLVACSGIAIADERLLIITVNAPPEQSEEVCVSLFHSSLGGFPNSKKAFYKACTMPSDGNAVFIVPSEGLKDGGRYAASAYQDVNENGVLDKNFLGIPKEPSGLSGEVKKFPPKFDDASFALSATGRTNVSIKLRDI